MSNIQWLTQGNAKLSKCILGWSITPVITCPNNNQCANTCYARKLEKLYPVCKRAWTRNYQLSKTREFKNTISTFIASKIKKIKYVRIHVSGDFYSQEYIDKWCSIVQEFPDIKFYTYTKTFNMFNFDNITSLANINIINSIAPDGGINYGDSKRIEYLKSIGYNVCPTQKGDNIICGENCKICIEKQKVCFNVH
jgi:hypothetical protein